VKINVNQIPIEGAVIEEDLAASELDLDTEIIKFRDPVKIRALVSRITNAVSIQATINTAMYTICGRCLQDLKIDFKKEINLNYPVDKSIQVIDLNPDIREEILLDYPIKPLCDPQCKGLCPKCGSKLNQEGGCTCATT
jgi:uncharacterized protein